MSRIDCISNRNIRIVAAYVDSKLGHCESLFDGLSYPSERYTTPDAFFFNEDEWTTYENFQKIFRKAREMVSEPYFYYYCGASSANLRSWGRLNYLVRVFKTPCDGFRRIPFFNKNLNDTKDIEVVLPPTHDRATGKMRTVLKVKHHPDIDVHRDYIFDPYRRGLLSSIPTIWGLRPAIIRQPLSPYDPVVLFKNEPEFARYGLNLRMNDRYLTLKHPLKERRKTVGKRVFLQAESLNGKTVYLGKYIDPAPADFRGATLVEAVLITETVRVNGRILLKAGEIMLAPYFILDITYDKLSIPDRLAQVFKFRRSREEPGAGLIEIIDRLREEIEAKNTAYRDLESVNAELIAMKNQVDETNRNLEGVVDKRTRELKQSRQVLMQVNRDLETKIRRQVEELERYQELRRYLSPNFAEKVLSSGGILGAEPQRKMLTMLFSDIRNFSSFTESLEPEELFHLLDRYISEMTRLIHQYEGTLNKIIGDGLLVFFGDPIPMDDHAQRAVRLAVDMQKRVAMLKDEWGQYGHEFGIGIGINTGYVTVGNIGSDMHRDYTVIGNQVNIASRLESRAKAGQILISHRTYSRVKSMVRTEKMGEIRVKGIHLPVATYNVRVDPFSGMESANRAMSRSISSSAASSAAVESKDETSS